MSNVVPDRYRRFASMALSLASIAHHEADRYYQLCALVVRKNRILSIGYNNSKTHPAAKTRQKQVHAEFDAIFRCAPEDLDGAEIIVVRARRDGTVGLAKPCAACEALIRSVRLKRVHYTTYSKDWNTPECIRMDLS